MKYLHRISLLLFVFFAFGTICFSQSTRTPSGTSLGAKQEDALAASNRVLLVYSLGDEIKLEDIKEVIDKTWKFNKEIQYVKNGTLAGILRSNPAKYAVLEVFRVYAESSSGYGTHVNEFTRFSIKLGEKYDKKRPVFFIDVPISYHNQKLYLTKSDIYFAVRFIQNHLIARKSGRRQGALYKENEGKEGKLENKTLLIDRALMDPKLEEKDIPTYYTYPYKVTDEKEIEKALSENDGRYAYVAITPTGEGINLTIHYVVDCDKGYVLSFGDLFHGAADFSYSTLINKKQLSSYIDHSK